jgi:hypothetical protein
MPSSADSLIHEATSLYRLVDSIDRLVAEHESIFAYTDATQSFFEEIHTQAKATKAKVSGITERALRTPEESASRYLGELIIQKGRWKTLHTYVKPAIDAHTLNLPGPVIEMAKKHLGGIPGLEKPTGEGSGRQVVVLLTPHLMYYQRPESQLPAWLVFVEVPYSQGPGFFSNLTIYHELGHYVFDSLAAAQERGPAFAKLIGAQERAFAENLHQAITTPSTRTWAKRVLDDWTKEIFCDLFALRHLGPAYAFALIDFLSLIGLMGEETEAKFDADHPAPALRFREQLRRMEEDGWWKIVGGLSSEHVSLVKKLAAKTQYSFEFQEKSVPRFVEAFQTIIPFIHELVIEITPHCGAAAEDFGRQRANVENCLLHGVVPSQLLVEGGALSPTPVSMINAAYCFYLTGLPRLISRFEDQEDSNLKHRQNWVQRVESWTMKGIEDFQLLDASRENTSSGN